MSYSSPLFPNPSRPGSTGAEEGTETHTPDVPDIPDTPDWHGPLGPHAPREFQGLTVLQCKLDLPGLPEPVPTPYPLPIAQEAGRRSGLVKAHTFAVLFPDRTEGTCRYERRAPAFHLFHFTYTDGASLPVQYLIRPLAQTLSAIEAKGRELAEPGFTQACREERERYFQRASPPGDGKRKLHPERSQMTAARAKKMGGRYALCRPHGSRGLIAVTVTYASLTDANAAWTEEQDARLIVACCNRLDRCWEMPKYNPLYAQYDPRIAFEAAGYKGAQVPQKGEFPWSSWR